ncbi:MAG: OmpA family protein [Desulfobacterales bacterium]|nr:MAG: OmpA family protein [Desulfobacterales bacterium]
MRKILLSFLMLLLYGLITGDSFADEDIKVIVRGRKAILNYQVIDDDRLLVSVLNSNEEPIRGLTPEDFIVGSGIQKAEILSAAPLETTEEIALNVVLVLDNSFSMKERRAVAPLLSAMDEFFKTVRPIDNIHLVVFDDHPVSQLREYGLHARTFHSSDVSKLQSFLEESFDYKSTGKTYLYEAMAAGIDIVRRMPEKDNKFMVVFSDGEDINSKVANVFIEEQAQGLKNFEAYCVDYMPGAKLDRFLASFAKNHAGRIWKATSASELLPIFQSFTTALRYRYVVAYRILEPVITDPAEFNFDILTRVDGSPMPNFIFFETGQSVIPQEYVLIKDPAGVESFDANSLATARARYLNILNLVGQNLSRNSAARIKIVGCNSNSGVEMDNLDLSRRRADSVKSYLQEIWGVADSRMGIEVRNLPDNATPMDLVGARQENQRVEIFYESDQMQTDAPGDFIVETGGRRDLKVKTNLFAADGFSDWQLTIFGDDQPFKNLTGRGDIPPDQTFSLQELDKARLSKFGALGVQAQVTDLRGDTWETSKVFIPITVSMEKWDDAIVRAPSGSLTLEPATVTIEELTTIDSSPFLNYIYFKTGESEIPSRYAIFKSQSEAQSFDESSLKDTMEKHHHILNIIGRRLLNHPDAIIRIVGCNSNRDEEHGRTDLSRSRAEAVRAYLKYIWGIEGARMQVEARNLPEVASTSSRIEGREENQRVEIYSESPALMDIVKSTYVQEISDAEQFLIQPRILSGYEIDQWTLKLTGDGTLIESLQGSGDIEPAYRVSLADIGLQKISAYRTVTAGIEVKDRKGQTVHVAADASIRFIKRQERKAQKQGYRVQEKYALILFDFDRSDIKEKNKEVIDRIVARIKQIPSVTVRIVGHTDTIGQEAYNIDLSIRRAKTAYDHILAGGVPAGDNITYAGVGPHDALFDNDLPEGRALNRTVTVTLEYEQTD